MQYYRKKMLFCILKKSPIDIFCDAFNMYYLSNKCFSLPSTKTKHKAKSLLSVQWNYTQQRIFAEVIFADRTLGKDFAKYVWEFV
jgi:hypothetical protein